MRQWLGETDPSSMQIELEGLRPIDRIPPTWNSDFLSGPLNAATLGCTARLLAASLLPRQTGMMGRRYSNASAGCLLSQGLYRTRTLSERIGRLSNWFGSGPAGPLDSRTYLGIGRFACFSPTSQLSFRTPNLPHKRPPANTL